MLIEERPPAAAFTEPAGLAPSYPPATEATPRRRAQRRWRIAAALLAFFLILFAYLMITAPLSKSLQPIAAPGLTLLSAEGQPIARRGAVYEAPVKVADLPDHVPAAFLAIEDRRFYNHSGVDPWGILRAAIRNVAAGGVVEGGSTITQQLAKLAFLSSDQTAARKLQEVLLAFWLEAWLDKNEILSRYMSSAYYGDNVYGLRAASRHYFSKQPEELNVGQAAMLAGMLKAPSRLAPTNDLKAARARGKVVLAAMVEAGSLTPAEAEDVPPVKLKVQKVRELPTGTYFADWVFPEARSASAQGAGDQAIQTTLEARLQSLAVRAVRGTGLGKAQIALVAMRPDGRVVAMVGGKNYKASPFNRATQARRQPGSTFKLFVYLAALRAGMTPESLVEDTPLRVGKWSPENYQNKYRGLITLREAFTVSSNVATVRISESIGRDKVIRAARDLGVTGDLGTQPSLALGAGGVSLIEMVAAYAAVAGGNYPVKAHGLPEQEKGWFESLRSTVRQCRGLSNRQAMLDLLWSAANRGTGRGAALSVNTFGKTGTSQDNRDAIFIGFAGDLVTGVWIGNDDNSPLRGVQGGGLPAQVWRNFMTRAVGAPPARPRPVEDFGRPVPIDESTVGVSVPVPGTGYEVGVEFAPDSVTLSADPGPAPPREYEPAPDEAYADEPEPFPEDEGPPLRDDIPTIAAPPPPPPSEDEEAFAPEEE